MRENVQVVVFPRGQLSPKDKERMTKHGIIAVEADEPAKVNVMPLGMPAVNPVSYDDLLLAALYGLKGHMIAQSQFADHLYSRLSKREAATRGMVRNSAAWNRVALHASLRRWLNPVGLHRRHGIQRRLHSCARRLDESRTQRTDSD